MTYGLGVQAYNSHGRPMAVLNITIRENPAGRFVRVGAGQGVARPAKLVAGEPEYDGERRHLRGSRAVAIAPANVEERVGDAEAGQRGSVRRLKVGLIVVIVYQQGAGGR